MKKHHYLLIFAAAAAGGFYLANAKTRTGIYANKLIGQTAANLYMAGASKGLSANSAATAPATATPAA
ncbi:MAG: hypothetical protein KGJ13_06985 [Patescibacteria group bacterium]|nr:hypothetical protein [Patescibacteria group bacterium]